MSDVHEELAGFIWSVADLLRHDYKQSEYGKVILPLTVLRRLDCVMEPTRKAVWARADSYTRANRDAILRRAAGGLPFYNVSRHSFATLGDDPGHVADALRDYINGFSYEPTEIINRFEFHIQIDRLEASGLLYKVVQRFKGIDLSPERVDNHEMGYVFEHLIGKFSEMSNETAGEHFTPREVIQLMVELLLAPDDEAFTGEGQVIDILDPACGTGGMLYAAEDHIKRLNTRARVNVFGQEVNAEAYAICRADLLIRGHDPSNIRFGNSFSNDQHVREEGYSYLLANPPFGVEWKKVQEQVEDEHRDLGMAGRFGPGLPRINDGSFLFLLHMIHKMRPVTNPGTSEERGGSRVAIVFNGSPLFSGGAGSGESEIRRWILENDYLEAIVALPDQLFYNTGISTYFWIVTNNKDARHRGKVILLDARDQWVKMRKSRMEKRKAIDKDQQIPNICRIYRDAFEIAEDFEHPDYGKVKIFDNYEFGYQRISIDRPLRLRFEITEDTLAALAGAKPLAKLDDQSTFVDALKPLLGSVWWSKAEAYDAMLQAVVASGLQWPSTTPILKAIRDIVGVADPKGEIQLLKGTPEPDPDLRDSENVPLHEDIDAYLEREVLPHVPDAWIGELKDLKTKTTTRAKIGYEIPFTRHFYTYAPPRPLAEIDAELKEVEFEIQKLLGEVTS